MKSFLTAEDMVRLNEALADVNEKRKADIKCTLEIPLSKGKAKIYHMGAKNPIVRVDFNNGK